MGRGLVACLFGSRAAVAAVVSLCASAFAIQAAESGSIYVVRHEQWSDADEAGYRDFIQAIGQSDCDTLDACLHSSANPFRDTDAPGHRFTSDCAELPYVLRFYYAWKRGLPFSYQSGMVSNEAGDIRYSHHGNTVAARQDVPGGVMSGYQIIDRIRSSISSATYRVHPDRDKPLAPDFYSPRLEPASIQPGTVVYDTAGHVAIVFRVEPDGHVYLFDGHTDNSLTQMVYDLRFARERPSIGAGFKNWRPLRLVGAKKAADGTLAGGHVEVAPNAAIAAFSDEQFYGNGLHPADEDWRRGTFTLNGETLDYYDYVRAQLAGGKLIFDPLKEVSEMVQANCANLSYRADAVDRAVKAGLSNQPQPPRLPDNIYGTAGPWETYSTPSRDARMKTVFKALRDTAQRFIEMQRSGDTRHLSYAGPDLAADMLSAYDAAAADCTVGYTRSDGSGVTLSYEQARQRLFAMSFDPYQCPERRWGASDAAELSTCRDGPVKQAWYAAEQNLRNQIERTYDARMSFTLDELHSPGPGKGVAEAPDTDVRAYLLSVQKRAAP